MEEYNNSELEQPRSNNKSARGYKVIILLLVVVLAGLSIIFWRQSNTLRQEHRMERDTLIANIEEFKYEIDNVRGANDEIAASLQAERSRADSLLNEIAKERRLSNSSIRKYEQELGTLRSIMRHYVQQIDSLGKINQKLANENIEMRRSTTEVGQRAAAAEERVTELAGQVQRGSVIRARDVKITPLNSKDREVTRVSRASRLRIDFTLSANALASVGERRIYVVLKGADGFVMTTEVSSTFDFEGDKLTYTAFRDVDYQGNDLPVGIYYNGAMKKGAHHVDIYMDGTRIGSGDAVLN